MLKNDSLNTFSDQAVFVIGQYSLSLAEFVFYTTCLLIIAIIATAVFFRRNLQARTASEAATRVQEAQTRMAELINSQKALTVRMQTMSEMFTTTQGDMMRSVNERLEGMSGRIGNSISETTKNTQESLAKLQERLAVIDTAQNNIVGLAGQVVELQNILSNKQTRGVFGEGRMQQIIRDGLPIGAYAFQATLTNRSRPDCIIHMPNDTPPLVIDAKFPLESWHRIRDAKTPEQAKVAATAFRTDVETHLKAISEKYFIKGETQDTAFMFLPSESIFAEIHENFESLVHKAHKARIVIVSPSLLKLSIQVMQSLLKDVSMREQAHLIQREIVTLMEDVKRVDERVRKLDTHFRQAQKDVGDILTSTEKVTRRGTKITELEFEEPQTAVDKDQSRLKAVE